MCSWQERLKFDPIPRLLFSGNEAITYFTERDILEVEEAPVNVLWELPGVQRILNGQQDNGSWKYRGSRHTHIRSDEDYDQLETYRILGILVEKYGLNKEHEAMRRTGDFLFRRQSEAGDFRGIYSNQYSPNYSAAIMELLIKAGYGDDPRVEKGFEWLLSIRQHDGGWTIPFRAAGKEYDSLEQAFNETKTLEPDKSKPFSHLVTGVVLRAFAAHPHYRESTEAQRAGELLKSRFFKADTYPDRKDAGFWTKLKYPFWFTDILSSLDSLSLLGFAKDDPHVKTALDWFLTNQHEDGIWKSPFKMQDREVDLWVTLAACRVFKRFDERAEIAGQP